MSAPGNGAHALARENEVFAAYLIASKNIFAIL
jgi:hypothetical protein